MDIIVTGAKGFVGKNLCVQLNNIKEGKAKCYGDLIIDEVFEYDIDSTPEDLDTYCKEADVVFNLADVNRPQNTEEFMQGNFGFASSLLDTINRLIQLRKEGIDEVLNHEISGENIQSVIILPRYNHNIINLSET